MTIRSHHRVFQSPAIVAGLIFVFGVLSRLALLPTAVRNPAPDEADYLALGHNLACHRGFTVPPGTLWPARFRSPGLPSLLAALFSVGANEIAARVVLILLSGSIGVAVYLVLRRLQARHCTSISAGLVAALHPRHAVLSGAFLADALSATGCIWFLYLLDSRDTRTVRHSALLGVGLFSLVALRSNHAVTLLLPLMAWARDLVRYNRRSLAVTLVVFVSLFSAASAWRSWQEGRFIPLTDAGSELFWRGNSLYAYQRFEGLKTEDYVPDYLATVGDPSRPGSDRLAWRSALQFIADDTRSWLALKCWMLLDTWRPYPSSLPATSQHAHSPLHSLGRTAYFLALGVLLVGFVLFLPTNLRGPERIHVLFVLGTTAFCTIFFPDPRYRLPADFSLLICATAGLDRWLRTRATALRAEPIRACR